MVNLGEKTKEMAMRLEMGHMVNDWRIGSVQVRNLLGKKGIVDEEIEIDWTMMMMNH